MTVEFRAEKRFWLALILLSASLILFAESIYMVKSFAILYGVGVGANVQSVYSGSQLVQSIQRISISASSFPIAIDISYVLSIISLCMIQGIRSGISCSRCILTPVSDIRSYSLFHQISFRYPRCARGRGA